MCSLTFLPPSNFAVFDCLDFLCYWLQRAENYKSLKLNCHAIVHIHYIEQWLLLATFATDLFLAFVVWRFWFGAHRVGRGQRNRKEIWAASPLVWACFALVFAASPLSCGRDKTAMLRRLTYFTQIHFTSLSCGLATQLTMATLAQARAFSSASSCEFHDKSDVGNLLCFWSIICNALLPCYLRSCSVFFSFKAPLI